MAIVIKEIEVRTIVEKRIVQDVEISNKVYTKIINQVILKLRTNHPKEQTIRKRER